MTRRTLFTLAALCALLALPQTAAAQECLGVLWSTHQTRNDGTSFIMEVETVDYDSDGKLDLVGLIATGSNSGTGVLHTWRGVGDGTFQAPVALGDSAGTEVTVADLNGDGRGDIVMTTFGQTIIVRMGNGTGFDAPISKWINHTANYHVIGEFTGDSHPDLITSAYSSNVFVVHRGLGNGDFTEIRRMPTAPTPGAVVMADFDNDGRKDVAYANRTDFTIDVAFQNSDGSFATPVQLPSANFPDDLEVGDFNEDGLPDLVGVSWISLYPRTSVAMVYRNLGGRTFHRTVFPWRVPQQDGNTDDVQVLDVNGDGHLDFVTASANSGAVSTFLGVGDGTFRSPTFYTHATNSSGYSLAFGDFDGDSVIDMALSAYQALIIVKRSCGSQLAFFTESKMITQGDTAPLRALVSGISAATPLPRGSVTFSKGAMVLGTIPVDTDGVAKLDYPGLSIGTHVIIAEFSGGSEVPDATAPSIEQKVTNLASETTLVVPGGTPSWGAPLTVWVNIRDRFGNQTYGRYILMIDGEERRGYSSQPASLVLEPGSHTLQAFYLGDAFDPASHTDPVQVNVSKASVALSKISGETTRRVGQQHSLQFSVTGPAGTNPTGTVDLIRNGVVVGSGAVSGGMATVTATLPRGGHDVLVQYSGSAYFNTASMNLTLNVLPNVPLAIDARGLQSGISIRAVVPELTSSAELYRSVAGVNDWTLVHGWTLTAHMDANHPARGILYDYRLTAIVDGVVSYSNVESALLLHDDPVAATMPMKRQHLDELRIAVNALRASASLPPFQFDATYAQNIVRASHLASLRTALTEARQALGMYAATFTDAAVAGTRLKAIHIQELRDYAR